MMKNTKYSPEILLWQQPKHHRNPNFIGQPDRQPRIYMVIEINWDSETAEKN